MKDSKLYLESKASFIDISSIASFKPFFVTWLRERCTFLDSSVVNLKSSPWPKYAQQGTIFQKKWCSTIKHFFLFKYVLHQTVLSKYLKKIGDHRAPVREKENLFRYLAQFEGNLLHFGRACAHVCALMMRKLCAIGMCNAVLTNYNVPQHDLLPNSA